MQDRITVAIQTEHDFAGCSGFDTLMRARGQSAVVRNDRAPKARASTTERECSTTSRDQTELASAKALAMHVQETFPD